MVLAWAAWFRAARLLACAGFGAGLGRAGRVPQLGFAWRKPGSSRLGWACAEARVLAWAARVWFGLGCAGFGLRGLGLRGFWVARVERRDSACGEARLAPRLGLCRGSACPEAQVDSCRGWGFGLGCAVRFRLGLRRSSVAIRARRDLAFAWARVWSARFGFGLGCAVWFRLGLRSLVLGCAGRASQVGFARAAQARRAARLGRGRASLRGPARRLARVDKTPCEHRFAQVLRGSSVAIRARRGWLGLRRGAGLGLAGFGPISPHF